MAKEVKNKEESKLQKELYALRNKLREFYRKKFEGELKKTHLIKATKKEIARILTKLNMLKRNG